MQLSFLKYSIICIVLGSCTVLQAQNVLLKKQIRTVEPDSDYNKVYPYYNADNKETAVFLEDPQSNAFDLFLNKDSGEKSKTLRGKIPKLRKPDFVGTSYHDSIYTAYFVDHGNYMIGVASFDLRTDKHSSKTQYIALKRNEKVFTQFEYNNKFYFVSLKKETSDLSFHIYQDKTFIEKRTIELNNEDFPHFLRDNLYNCIAYNNGEFKSADLFNPLYADQESDYFLTQNNVFYLVVNTHKVVQVNLDEFNAKVLDFPVNYKEDNESYKKSILKNVVKKTKSKSRVYDNYFFRVNIGKDNIRLQVYDINTKKELVNTVVKEDSIIADVIYNTEHKREVDTDTKESLLYAALLKGKFGFRVYKELNDYKIDLGKVATNDFWDLFDEKSNPEVNNSRFEFDNKFVGMFSDYSGDKLTSHLLSPFFVKEDIQSRYFEFTFNSTNKQLSGIEDKEGGQNKFTRFTDLIKSPVYNHKLNGFFSFQGGTGFILYDSGLNELSIFKL